MPGIEGHLTDAKRHLAAEDRQTIEDLLGQVQAEANADMAVLILATRAESLRSMGEACFQTWNIGKSWERGGLLLIISADLKDCAVITGSNGVTLSAQTVKEMETALKERLRHGALLDGLKGSIRRVRRELLGEAALKVVEGNPPVPNIEGHITDAAHRLSELERRTVDEQLGQLQVDAQVDLAIVILTRPAESLPDMANSCFRNWNIGRSWNGGGILLAISHDLRDCSIVTSESDFPLANAAARELEGLVRERLRKGELFASLTGAIGRVRNLVVSARPSSGVSGNPAVPGIESHLTDAGKKLSEADRKRVDELLGAIQAELKVDAVFFVLNSAVQSLPEMGRSCFDTWSIGKSWAGGGVLLIISQDLKDCSVVTSSPDKPLKPELAEQLENYVRVRLRQGSLNSALLSAVGKINRQLWLSGHLPKVYPRFKPDVEGAWRYLRGLALISLLAVVSWGWRRRR